MVPVGVCRPEAQSRLLRPSVSYSFVEQQVWTSVIPVRLEHILR